MLQWPKNLVYGLACELIPEIFTPGDLVVALGEYGQRFFILRDFGQVRYDSEENFDLVKNNTVSFDDMIPFVGATALLSPEKAKKFATDHADLQNNLLLSRVCAEHTTLVMAINQQAVSSLVTKYWPDGENHIEHIVGLHYKMQKILEDPNYVPQTQKYKLARRSQTKKTKTTTKVELQSETTMTNAAFKAPKLTGKTAILFCIASASPLTSDCLLL